MNRYLLSLALLAAPAVQAAELPYLTCRPPVQEVAPDAAVVAQAGWPAARLQAAGRASLALNQCGTAQVYLRAAFDAIVADTDPAVVAATLHDLMRIALVANNREAIDILEPKLLAAWDRGGVSMPGEAANVYASLFRLRIAAADYPGAENLARRRLALVKLAPDAETNVRRATYDVARALYGQLRYADAEAILAPYATAARRLPAPYFERQRVREEMIALVRSGKLKEALALGEPALRTYEADTARAFEQLEQALAQATAAQTLPEQAKRDAANVAARRARSHWHGEALTVADTMSELGEIHHAMNQLAQAEALYDSALALYAKARPTDQTKLALVQAALATLYRSSGRAEQALPLLASAKAIYLAAGGAQHPDVLETQAGIARTEAAIAARNQPAVQPPAAQPSPAKPVTAPSAKRKARG